MSRPAPRKRLPSYPAPLVLDKRFTYWKFIMSEADGTSQRVCVANVTSLSAPEARRAKAWLTRWLAAYEARKGRP